MHLLLAGELVVNQGILPRHPLDLMSLGIDEEVPVAPADAAIAHLDGDVVSGLPGQHLVLEPEANGAAVAAAGVPDLGHGVIVEAPDDGVRWALC